MCPHELPGLSVCPSIRLSSSRYLRPFVCQQLCVRTNFRGCPSVRPSVCLPVGTFVRSSVSSCRVDYSITINWTSPFPMLGVSGVLFYFYSISNSNSCYQTVKTLIRRRVLRRLIWVCTVCLCPKTEFNNLRKIICLRKIVSLTFQN